MANSQHKYLLERGWTQQQIDEVVRKAHEWLRGAGYTPLTEQGHWNGIMGNTQSYHLPSKEKDARGMTEAFVEMLKGGKILDARRVHKFSRPGAKDTMAKFKIGDRIAYKAHVANTAGELVEIRKPTSLEGVEMQYGIRQASGAIMWVPEGMVVRASRPGTPARFAVEDRFYFGKGRKER